MAIFGPNLLKILQLFLHLKAVRLPSYAMKKRTPTRSHYNSDKIEFQRHRHKTTTSTRDILSNLVQFQRKINQRITESRNFKDAPNLSTPM